MIFKTFDDLVSDFKGEIKEKFPLADTKNTSLIMTTNFPILKRISDFYIELLSFKNSVDIYTAFGEDLDRILGNLSFYRLLDETDEDYRNRWLNSMSVVWTKGYVEEEVCKVDGVKSCYALFNDTGSTITIKYGSEILKNQLCVLVYGNGDVDNIAQSIFDSIPVGSSLAGSVKGQATDVDGSKVDVWFEYAIPVTIQYILDISGSNIDKSACKTLVDAYINNLGIGAEVNSYKIERFLSIQKEARNAEDINVTIKRLNDTVYSRRIQLEKYEVAYNG